MNVVDIQIIRLREAPWNANRMVDAMVSHLKESLNVYGIVNPLVVRPLDKSKYEVLSGNQRLKAIRDLGYQSAPCVVVNLNDDEAKLLAQALNNIHGNDDLGIKGNLLKQLLASIPKGKILSVLPETNESLMSLSTLDQADLAEHLKAWEEAQAARLKHWQLQLTNQQLATIQEAVSLIMPKAKNESIENPNLRSTAMYLLCKFYLERRGKE
jgi:ParB family chromosome partitioning protein